jgi:hypothetical protein
MEVLKSDIYATLEEQNPATCRGLFYALVSKGVIDKTEVEYKSTVIRLTGKMRREGTLPYGWLADNTRWMRKNPSWGSLEEAIEDTARYYRRDLWRSSDAYVEVWLEKDALAGVIIDETNRWDVPLMVTRGYASLSFLYSAAETISAVDKPTHIYYLGEHDPSGVDIPKKVESELRRMAAEVEITFTRLGVNPEQIEELSLPTRPTKKTDTRAKNFTGESVEVDAIPAPMLRDMVQDAILTHVDHLHLRHLRVVEAEERKMLRMFPTLSADREAI